MANDYVFKNTNGVSWGKVHTVVATDITDGMVFILTSKGDMAVSLLVLDTDGAIQAFTGTIVSSKNANGFTVITITDNATPSLTAGDKIHITCSKVYS